MHTNSAVLTDIKHSQSSQNTSRIGVQHTIPPSQPPEVPAKTHDHDSSHLLFPLIHMFMYFNSPSLMRILHCVYWDQLKNHNPEIRIRAGSWFFSWLILCLNSEVHVYTCTGSSFLTSTFTGWSDAWWDSTEWDEGADCTLLLFWIKLSELPFTEVVEAMSSYGAL